MKKTFGIFAHVDAGKTTFSEQILYHSGCIKKRGRVDHKDAFLDTHEIEKRRGITIFSDQAIFTYNNTTYFLLDTPGHVDFSAEMERCMKVLDYAILLISKTDGVQSHTQTVWKLLEQYKIPTFFFINKIDLQTNDSICLEQELKKQLTKNVVIFQDNYTIEKSSNNFLSNETLKETIVEREDNLLEIYLDTPEKLNWNSTIVELIKQQKIVPCMYGSALANIGIDSFFELFHLLTETVYETKEKSDFLANVYKIQITEKKEKLVYIKVLSGTIKIKDEIQGEKINQIFEIHGMKKSKVSQLVAGDLGIVVGIHQIKTGDFIGNNLKIQEMGCHDKITYQILPTMQAKVLYQQQFQQEVLEIFHILEEEEPQLQTSWDTSLQQLRIHIMGKIQLEVIKEIIEERFQIHIEFDSPEVLYLETIKSPVMGYGHFEPLRHYAEVALYLEPKERGTGIHCESKCHVDRLALNYQNAILAHIKERKHKGVLIGAPITDLNIVLMTGISHLKHTEGGDFREAVYRAVRQGLEKAESILLEPMYVITIQVSLEYIGKVLSDIARLTGKFDPPIMADMYATITGRGPVSTWMNYGEELLSFTKGRGKIQLQYAGYDICHNSQEVIEMINYKKDEDIENTSCSVFCKKGTSFVVKGVEAEVYMHCLK